VYNLEAGALVKELAVNISAFQAGVIPPPLAVVIDSLFVQFLIRVICG